MEKKLNNLFWLNERLLQFSEEQQVSIKKARKLLKTKVFINIYDLEAEKYEKKTTKQLLKKELGKHVERRFPLFIAKKKYNFKMFSNKAIIKHYFNYHMYFFNIIFIILKMCKKFEYLNK